MSSLLSLLNSWNPLHKSTAPPPTRTIWLLDATAFQTPAGKPTDGTTAITPDHWTLHMLAAYFAANTSPKLADVLDEIRGWLGLEEGSKELRTVEERLRPFFAEVLEGRGCSVVFSEVKGNKGKGKGTLPVDGKPGSGSGDGKVRVVKLGKQGGVEGKEAEKGSDANGISRDEVELVGTWKDGDVVVARLAGKDAKTAEKEVDDGMGEDETICVEANVTFAGPEGWAIISDIDDTIKKTLTNSSTGILRTTFVDEPEVIRGMPELYHHMLRALKEPPFWYLSASPYNLYPFLHAFRSAHFPDGTMLLKNASWQNVAGFLASLSKGVQEYKVEKLCSIQARFPKRRVMLIGDSTQKDPESYAEVAKKFPGWVGKIFIRKVGNVKEFTDVLPGQGNKERNTPERFEKAFEGLDRNLWRVFDEPEELYADIDAAAKEYS